jgi:hypothetical protein
MPADIDSIGATSFYNLKRKDIIYMAMALCAIIVLNFLLPIPMILKMFSTVLVCIIFAIPIMIEHSPLFGISSEEFIVNMLRFILSHKKRHYSNVESGGAYEMCKTRKKRTA